MRLPMTLPGLAEPLVAARVAPASGSISTLAGRLALALAMVLALALAISGCTTAPGSATSAPRAAQVGQLVAAMLAHPIVLLGEVHDNAPQHALRAEALADYLRGGARPALLMEQFDREHQAELDRARLVPGASAESVIEAAAPGDPAMQGWDWAYYRPYVALALRYRLPLIAANVSRDDTRRVITEGLAPAGFDGAVPADIASSQAQSIVEGHCGLIDEQQAGRMVGAQVARDQFMARALDAWAGRGAVLLAGNGHTRRDVGVPRWLAPKARAESVSIGLLEPGDPNAGAYDLALTTAAQPREDPCAAMRAMVVKPPAVPAPAPARTP